MIATVLSQIPQNKEVVGHQSPGDTGAVVGIKCEMAAGMNAICETPRRSYLRKRLAMMVAAVPLLYTGSANANERDQVVGGGFFIGYSFGTESVEWGVEAFSVQPDPCARCSEATSVFGAIVRISVRSSQPVLSVSGMLGTQFSADIKAPSLGVELGLAFSAKTPISVLSGVYAEKVGLNLYARQYWSEKRFPVGVGLRTSTTDSHSSEQVIEGRPFRDGFGLTQAAWSPDSDAKSTALGQHWQTRAHEECASIPAFLQLASELLALGAPDDLIERALNAAAEELRHTRMATHLARRFGAHQTDPQIPTFTPRAPLGRQAQLTRLARESWLDGCLGEGAAAAIAGAEAVVSEDRQVRTILSAIEVDEAGHAGLAWDILQWTLREDPSIAKVIRAERLREFGMSSRILSSEDKRQVLRSSHRLGRDRLSEII